MKKLVYLSVILSMVTILSTGCHKDSLGLVGTKWSATLHTTNGDDLTWRIDFVDKKTVDFILSSLSYNDSGTLTGSYTVSGNTIRINMEGDILSFEKTDNAIYFDGVAFGVSGVSIIFKRY